MAPHYWELTVSVPGEVSEGLANLVWELGALGVVEEERPGSAPCLRAFFPDTPLDALTASVHDYLADLRALGFRVAEEPSISRLSDPGWAEAWQEHFRPLPVGRGLIIAPSWATPPPNGRLVITIDPGRAFGTGHHGTTAGCLSVLEDLVERHHPERAIDFGTGSGILAIAAARLGVARVVAVDDDPDAVANAMANAARNHVSDRVHCVLGDAGALSTEPAPLVLANLMRAAHLRLAPVYRRALAPGGALVVGGLLEAEADEVAEALGREGLDRRRGIALEGWTTLEMRRRE